MEPAKTPPKASHRLHESPPPWAPACRPVRLAGGGPAGVKPANRPYSQSRRHPPAAGGGASVPMVRNSGCPTANPEVAPRLCCNAAGAAAVPDSPGWVTSSGRRAAPVAPCALRLLRARNSRQPFARAARIRAAPIRRYFPENVLGFCAMAMRHFLDGRRGPAPQRRSRRRGRLRPRRAGAFESRQTTHWQERFFPWPAAAGLRLSSSGCQLARPLRLTGPFLSHPERSP